MVSPSFPHFAVNAPGWRIPQETDRTVAEKCSNRYENGSNGCFGFSMCLGTARCVSVCVLFARYEEGHVAACVNMFQEAESVCVCVRFKPKMFVMDQCSTVENTQKMSPKRDINTGGMHLPEACVFV